MEREVLNRSVIVRTCNGGRRWRSVSYLQCSKQVEVTKLVDVPIAIKLWRYRDWHCVNKSRIFRSIAVGFNYLVLASCFIYKRGVISLAIKCSTLGGGSFKTKNLEFVRSGQTQQEIRLWLEAHLSATKCSLTHFTVIIELSSDNRRSFSYYE